jgi:uncharacterized protein YgiB involved in biofilm formation
MITDMRLENLHRRAVTTQFWRERHDYDCSNSGPSSSAWCSRGGWKMRKERVETRPKYQALVDSFEIITWPRGQRIGFADAGSKESKWCYV